MPPLCFILMPFGRKPGPGGRMIDFDSVYHELIAPAVKTAGLKAIRADEEQQGGVIHKPMFERLILCEYAVADLSTANANVFYELGVRHAIRRASTVLLFAEGLGQLPFDVAPLRALPYRLDKDGTPKNGAQTQKAIVKLLREARKQSTDSPVFQLVKEFPNIDRLKTDVFRDEVEYSEKLKAKLAGARKKSASSVRAVQESLGDLREIDAGVLVDLFLSYRATKDWQAMIKLVDEMPEPLAATVLVQEQLGLALNRAGKGQEAEGILRAVIDSRGPSSETYGLLGRVYKDRWEAERRSSGDSLAANGLLDQAIDAYAKGFGADIRDAYPGINAVTLMEIRDPPDARRLELLPVVTHAVKMRIEGGKPDYWDYATRLELAVLRKDEADATASAAAALARVREAFEPETTARNLRLIREARERRRESVPWAKGIEEQLEKRAKA